MVFALFLSCKERSVENVQNELPVMSAKNEKENLTGKDIYIAKIDTNSVANKTGIIVASEYIISNESFKQLLDLVLDEYHACKNAEKGYYFRIDIGDATIHDSPDGKYVSFDTIGATEAMSAKSLYIARSFEKDYVLGCYGYCYYKDNLFILDGTKLEEVFTVTDKKHSFTYKYRPPMFDDPPRWTVCYWNKVFYIVNKSPCGG